MNTEFNLDQECRNAMERIRVSVEANANYELKKMRTMYAAEKDAKDREQAADSIIAFFRQKDAMMNAYNCYDFMLSAKNAQNAAYNANALGLYSGNGLDLQRALYG